MKKNLLSFFMALVCVFALVSCTGSKTHKIIYELDGGINDVNNPTEYKEGDVITLKPATKEGYNFISWTYEGNVITEINSEMTTDITLVANFRLKFNGTTPITDSYKLDADYANKDYFEDGIGVVTVVQYVDGDTTIFRTKNGHSITVRYQGVDTPESTYTVEPWGFAASNHTKETLKNAKEIVLQTDDGNPGKDNADTTGKRYLAWVWADGRLLNLELVELALAHSKAASTTLKSYFDEAVKSGLASKARIYGEKDPDFDYSTEYEEISLKDLHEKYGTASAINQELDKGKKVKVSGTIVRRLGVTSAYLQQLYIDESTGEEHIYGVYLYGGFNENNRLNVGYSVIVTGTISYYGGALQISDVSTSHVKVQSMTDQDKVKKIEPEDLSAYLKDEMHIGNLIQINTPITITRTYDADETNAFSLNGTYVDNNGKTQTLSIRIDKNVTLKDENGDRITSGEYFVGKKLSSLTAIVGYYDPSQDDVHNGYVQLLLVSSADYKLAD